MSAFKVGDSVHYVGPASVSEHSGTGVVQEVKGGARYRIQWNAGEYTTEPASNLRFQRETSFEQSVRYHTNKIADLLIAKNKAYGDSALNPVRIFSKSDRMEQLYIRLDDKLSRVQKGHEYPGDDTLQDIIGYCTLILIARESN